MSPDSILPSYMVRMRKTHEKMSLFIILHNIHTYVHTTHVAS